MLRQCLIGFRSVVAVELSVVHEWWRINLEVDKLVLVNFFKFTCFFLRILIGKMFTVNR